MSAKPYAIHDTAGIPVQRFATYRSAEAAAVAWCQQKRGSVDIFQRRTKLATVTPNGDRAPVIDMTMAGSMAA